MPVIRTTPEECDMWLEALMPIALELQRPLAEEALIIVARGGKQDGLEGRLVFDVPYMFLHVSPTLALRSRHRPPVPHEYGWTQEKQERRCRILGHGGVARRDSVDGWLRHPIH
jgi:hypothetical protein